MAEIITIATRRVSGVGLILPSSEQLNYRRYYLYADIIRKPTSPYFSAETSPPQTYYGTISLMKDDYVLQTYKIQHDAQTWVFDADITGQVINTIKCVYEGILQSFVNLGTAQLLIVTSVENTIDDWKNLPLEWDSIRIKCFADCAIQVVLKGLEYDVCDVDDKILRDPPSPPQKPSPVSPGQGTDIDSPYTDDSITDPAQIDENYMPPPIGNDCQAYSVEIEWDNTFGDPIRETRPFLGPIGSIRKYIGGDRSDIELECRGPAGQSCKPLGFFSFGGTSTANDYNNPRIVSIA